jgi:putative hydrolase of the HAD superfamily
VKKWRAIAFDLDDTLYPEAEYVRSGFRQVAAWIEGRLGTPAETSYRELEHLFHEGVRGNLFDLWLAAHDRVNPSVISEMVQVYREHAPSIAPFPEVPKLLRGLSNRYQLGLLSDGTLAVQRRKLAALELSQWFQCVVFCDEWGREAWKPNVRCFLHLAESFGLSPGEVVYVGDNPSKDFLGARNAGLMTIWIRRPGLLYTHLEPMTPNHCPDLTLNSLDELPAVLEQVKLS